MAFYDSYTSRSDIMVAGGAIGGATVGALQTILLREFVDNSMAKAFLTNTTGNTPFLMKQLKGFGSPSAIFGIAGGVVGLVLGLMSLLKGKIIRHAGAGAVLTGYGVTALLTGGLSGALPTPAWQAATAADPNNPIGVSKARRGNVTVNGSNGVVRPTPQTLSA